METATELVRQTAMECTANVIEAVIVIGAVIAVATEKIQRHWER